LDDSKIEYLLQQPGDVLRELFGKGSKGGAKSAIEGFGGGS